MPGFRSTVDFSHSTIGIGDDIDWCAAYIHVALDLTRVGVEPLLQWNVMSIQQHKC